MANQYFSICPPTNYISFALEVKKSCLVLPCVVFVQFCLVSQSEVLHSWGPWFSKLLFYSYSAIINLILCICAMNHVHLGHPMKSLFQIDCLLAFFCHPIWIFFLKTLIYDFILFQFYRVKQPQNKNTMPKKPQKVRRKGASRSWTHRSNKKKKFEHQWNSSHYS